MKLVLDTNAYCDYAQGIPGIVDIMAENGENIFIPAPVVGELNYGFMKGTRQEYNERKFREITEKLKISIIDINRDVARKYAIIYLSLARMGSKIPINDVWIAACCMEVGGVLLTRDNHFRNIKQIDSIIVG